MLHAVVVIGVIGVLLPAAVLARTGSGSPSRTVPPSREVLQLSFGPVVRQVAPAVVNIYTRRVVREEGRSSPLFRDPFFRRFFGEDASNEGQRERVQSALGSGVLVRPEGIIVTNAHVIRDSEEITVALADRREFEAETIMTDAQTDVAILRIHPAGRPLPYLRFRDSDSVEVGDIVLAIGNPFGVGQTVTSGIVSALARTHVQATDYQFFIQTDAAINPGNSGGPLVTLDGRLLGISTAILSNAGSTAGIGFAIPSNIVRSVVDAALSRGTIVRPWLGASGQAVTRAFAPSLGLDRPTGVMIERVFPGGPADKVGLRVGDVVLSVDGIEVFDEPGLTYRIATRREDEQVRLDIMREGIRMAIGIAVSRPPETPPRNLTTLEGQHALAGAVVGNLSPAFAVELGLNPVTARGVVVADVAPDSPAEQVGVKPRDVILSVNGEGIGGIEELTRTIQATARQWRITIRRYDQLLVFDVTSESSGTPP